jgi:hypothetical protein
MANEPEQIEIEIEEPVAKAEKDDIQVVKAEETPERSSSKTIEPEEGIESLRAQLERERLARIEAERRAHTAAQTVQRAQSEVQDSNLHLVNNAIETVRQNNEILKANYRDAMSSNDYDRAAEMQQAMSTNAAKLLQLEQGKEALENAPKPVVEQYVNPDPVEALASQLTPRSADWVRRNPQYATDARLYQKMIAAHQLAVSDNIRPDTDEYFEAIEETLRIRQRQQETRHEDPTATAAQVTQRRSAPPAAPVTRSGTGTSNRPNTVRLTAAEREMASMMQMTDQEYARNKLTLQKEGKLN